jgi:hypothetical protein
MNNETNNKIPTHWMDDPENAALVQAMDAVAVADNPENRKFKGKK